MPDSSSTTVCPSCGTETSGKFCAECGTSLAAAGCPTCGAPIVPGARFCNTCGASLAGVAVPASAAGGAPVRVGASGSSDAIARYATWGFALVLLVAVVAYFTGRGTGDSADAAGAGAAGTAPFAMGGGAAPGPGAPVGAGGAPDISSMTPREQATRLHDRIMRYASEGKADSAAFFAPMALQVYSMLGAGLDAGTRYDYGRVATETGNFDVAQAQADTILKASPTHLLGLALAARNAAKRGDPSGAAKYWKQFAAVKASELQKKLPEYGTHTADIEIGAGVLSK